MNAEARANRLEKLGVEVLAELPFDAGLSGLTAEAFARDVLAEGLGVSHVVVGADFCFGKGRTGTTDMLRDLGRALGFDVTDRAASGGHQGAVSSTAIRTALTEGDPRAAAEMLGHWHRIEGPVLHGEKRGRQLGYPTANMELAGLHVPKLGVYAVVVDVLTGPHAGQLPRRRQSRHPAHVRTPHAEPRDLRLRLLRRSLRTAPVGRVGRLPPPRDGVRRARRN
jgi:riboflavin kinase/FMN adenylyltransferase